MSLKRSQEGQGRRSPAKSAKMPRVLGTVVRSSQDLDLLSLRGPGGEGDGIKKYLMGVFQEGDKVVILRQKDFEKLMLKGMPRG